AAGKLIAFLDADDFWKPDFLAKCVSFLNEHSECVAVNTGLLTRMHDGSEVIHPSFLRRQNVSAKPFVLEDFYDFWAKHDHVRTGSAVIRKPVIDKAGGQRADLRVSQDLEYWGYIATFGHWGYIPEPLWVGNSRAAASGWLTKYRMRRKHCPTLESWQKRILPRLTPAQFPYFKIVRGRVAAGYAHNHILGGNFAQAKHIVQTYGLEMPKNRLTRLLNGGLSAGRHGWHTACLSVIAHEYVKALFLGARARILAIRSVK
ncbi:MAG: glycosyltransferase, partial [Deltaproteobacteria bacterium]|nr:glycosyltransferase [Deltaproteobacteria bacterium]